MNKLIQKFGTKVTQAVAWCMVLLAYFFACEPYHSVDEKTHLFEPFRFKISDIDVSFTNEKFKFQRKVHPSLARISAWISGTGAACTLGDLDGDGSENDLILVDPRIDSIIVEPIGGSQPYERFVVDFGSLEYDEKTMAPSGSLIGDFDENGFPDLLVYFWGRAPIIFRQLSSEAIQGPKSFVATELISVGASTRWYTHTATQADFNSDGHIDLLLGNFFQDGANVLDASGTGIEKVMHDGKSKAKNGGGAKLFIWDADEQSGFRNETDSIEEVCGKGWVLATGTADLDGDGFPEIYIANDFGPDCLLHNRSSKNELKFALCYGRRFLTTPKSFQLGKDSFKGMGVDFVDINLDGKFDVLVSNIADKWALQESHFAWINSGEDESFRVGRAPFQQKSESLGLSRSGWGWDIRGVDLDNDGQFEVLQANGFSKGDTKKWAALHALGTSNDRLVHNPEFWPRFQEGDDLSGDDRNAFYVWNGDMFVDCAEVGIGEASCRNTRGIAISDINNDGRLDFVFANQFQPSQLFLNQSDATNNFLSLRIVRSLEEITEAYVESGPIQTRGKFLPAIGSQVRIHLTQEQTSVAQVDGGSGHSGKSAKAVHFGLRESESAKIVIEWNDVGQQKEIELTLQSGIHTIVLPNSKGQY